MRIIRRIIVFSFLLLMLPLTLGHLVAGEDKIVNGYLVDFGHAPEELNERENIVLAFNLINESTDVPLEPTKVWVRISMGDKIVFAGMFYPDIENVAFEYTFPEGGHYDIDVRFYEDREILIETDFEIEVGEHSHDDEVFGDSNLLFVSSILNIILLIAIISMGRKSKNRKLKNP